MCANVNQLHVSWMGRFELILMQTTSASILIRIWNISLRTLNWSSFFRFVSALAVSIRFFASCVLFAKQTFEYENYDNVTEKKSRYLILILSGCILSKCLENVSLGASNRLGILISFSAFFFWFGYALYSFCHSLINWCINPSKLFRQPRALSVPLRTMLQIYHE